MKPMGYDMLTRLFTMSSLLNTDAITTTESSGAEDRHSGDIMLRPPTVLSCLAGFLSTR